MASNWAPKLTPTPWNSVVIAMPVVRPASDSEETYGNARCRVMMVAARPIGEFVDRHPTVRMLALSFSVLIGTALVAESLDLHIPKGCIYFAMAYAVVVEMLNLRLRNRRREPPAAEV